MRWHPGFFFGCIAFAWAQKEHAASYDDMLGMLQNTLRVTKNSNETDFQGVDVHEIERGGGAPTMSAVSRLEKMVMAKVHDGVTGDAKLSATVNNSIKYMQAGILVSTKANQKMVKNAIDAFRKCKVGIWNSYKKTVALEKKYWKLSQIYPKCLGAEEKTLVAKIVGTKSIIHIQNMMKRLKALIKYQGRSCGNVCANQGHEGYHQQLRRLTRFYRKCRKKLFPFYQRFADMKKAYKKKKPAADEHINRYKAMKNKCKLIAYLMNTRKCEAVTHMEVSCKGYLGCWVAAKKQYNKIVPEIMREEKDMKVQWRALKRIQCYLQVLDEKDKAKNKKVLNACIKMKKPSTKPLDIDYGKIPPKPRCPKDPSCPCSTHYVLKNYHVGPKQRCRKNIKTYSCAICKKKQWKKGHKSGKRKRRKRKSGGDGDGDGGDGS